MGLVDQRTDDSYPLALPAGELAGAMGEAIGKANAREKAGGTGGGWLGGRCGGRRAGGGGRDQARRLSYFGERGYQDVFQDGALGQEVVRLEDEANLLVAHRSQLGLVEAAQVPAVERNLSASRLVEGADDLEQGAFARAGRPDDGQRFAPPDLKRNPVEHSERAGTSG